MVEGCWLRGCLRPLDFNPLLACKHCLHYIQVMHATIYGRGQMVIPAKARKEARIDTGDVVAVQPEGDGRLLLVRLEKPKSGRRSIRLLKRKGKHSVLTGGPVVTDEQVRAALAGLP